MSLDKIIGQENAVNTLKSAIARKRIPHAFIFAGPEKSGRMNLAINFAKALNCVNRIDETSCDSCLSCVKIDKNIHPDVRIIRGAGKTEDITIEQIRELESSITFKPYEGLNKIFIINDAHLMNSSAANSFLKTLEEPPKNSIIILITEDPRNLLPTISSRCQIIRVKPMEKESLAHLLVSEYGIEKVKAESLARVSCGLLGRALAYSHSMFDERDIALNRFYAEEYIDGLSQMPRSEIIKDITYVIGWYRDIMVYQATQDRESVINFDKIENIAEESLSLSTAETIDILTGLFRAKDDIEDNVNPKLALSVLVKGVNICTK